MAVSLPILLAVLATAAPAEPRQAGSMSAPPAEPAGEATAPPVLPPMPGTQPPPTKPDAGPVKTPEPPSRPPAAELPPDLRPPFRPSQENATTRSTVRLQLVDLRDPFQPAPRPRFQQTRPLAVELADLKDPFLLAVNRRSGRWREPLPLPGDIRDPFRPLPSITPPGGCRPNQAAAGAIVIDGHAVPVQRPRSLVRNPCPEPYPDTPDLRDPFRATQRR